jgi:hypothetical protein
MRFRILHRYVSLAPTEGKICCENYVRYLSSCPAVWCPVSPQHRPLTESPSSGREWDSSLEQRRKKIKECTGTIALENNVLTS